MLEKNYIFTIILKNLPASYSGKFLLGQIIMTEDGVHQIITCTSNRQVIL